uniref:CUB domain-containing protein n=1 Tax=Strigops habroptila TaxID=2489341 RepID=A0A672TTC7_STRHB
MCVTYINISLYVFRPKACGSFIESDSVGAAISSPLYPAKYPENQNCSWIIQAQEPCNSPGNRLQLPLAESLSCSLPMRWISEPLCFRASNSGCCQEGEH